MNDLRKTNCSAPISTAKLTAAEQAEVERLLAADPAARQLLDELRALSAALHALPQQKLGEDLSRQVLRVAERRMPPRASRASRSLRPRRRRRACFRALRQSADAGLAESDRGRRRQIAINEWQHRGPRAERGDREVASARPALEDKAARGPVEPPTSGGPRPIGGGCQQGDFLGAGTGSREEDRTGGDARGGQGGIAEPEVGGRVGRTGNAVGEKDQLGAGGPPPTKAGPPPAKLAIPADKTGHSGENGPIRRRSGRQIGRHQAEGRTSAGGLLRHITPEAANQAFGKLLEANGVVWAGSAGSVVRGWRPTRDDTGPRRAG